MTASQSLPARTERSAPKWDSTYEEQLPTFFEEFESVAQVAGIHGNDVGMKKGVLRYLDPQSLRFWRTLKSYKDTTKTWDEFKTEVLSHYPGALEEEETTTEDLEKVVLAYRKSGITNRKKLGMYHRDFSVVSDYLEEHGILTSIQIENLYIQAFSDSIRTRLNMNLQLAKAKGQAYSLTKLRQEIDFLLSDASIAVITEKTSSAFIPVSSSTGPITSSVALEHELLEERINQLTELVTSLTQVVSQIVARIDSITSRPAKSSDTSSSKCFWDDCDSPRFDECADLREWVAKGHIERDGKGFVRLKGGQRLPRTTRYTEGTLKQRFERYFEDHPAEKTLSRESSSVEPRLYEGQHISSTTVPVFQGPAMMMEKASTFPVIPLEQGGHEDEPEVEAIRQLISKFEIRRAAREKANNDIPDSISTPPPPEPSLLPPNPNPAHVPRPVIGKLSPNYIPSQQRIIGTPSKDDPRNLQYCAPIETEAAIRRVVQAWLSSMVSIRQDDLLAIAPEYRRKVEEIVTNRRLGVDGNPSEAEEQPYLLDRQDVALSTTNSTASEPETDVFPCAQVEKQGIRETFMNKRNKRRG